MSKGKVFSILHRRWGIRLPGGERMDGGGISKREGLVEKPKRLRR